MKRRQFLSRSAAALAAAASAPLVSAHVAHGIPQETPEGKNLAQPS